MKWIFFDLGSTLVDESDVTESRLKYAAGHADIDLEAFRVKVCEEAKTSATPIVTAARAYGVELPKWDNSLEKLYPAAPMVLSELYGKYKLGIIACYYSQLI